MYGDNTSSETISDLPWSHRLSRILQPTSSILLINRPTFIIPPPTYPSGEIWKHIFNNCVYSDLAGPGSNKLSWGKSNRRFVRFERIGLSGVILYEIPVICGSIGCVRPAFTIEEVFGNDFVDGMSITRLWELTNAKMVYFPAYACTSFTMGQVMHAFLTNAPSSRPYPAHDGFHVFPDGTGDDVKDWLGGDSSIDSLGPDTPPRVDSPPIQEPKQLCDMSLADACQIV